MEPLVTKDHCKGPSAGAFTIAGRVLAHALKYR